MRRTHLGSRLTLLSVVLTSFLPGHLLAQTDGGNSEQAPNGCCIGRVGDVNGLGGDEPTIGDIVDLVIWSYSGHLSPLGCLSEADVNQSGGANPTFDDITIGDLTILIDHLFITGPSAHTLPLCLEGGAR